MSQVYLSKPLQEFSGYMFNDNDKMNPYMFTLGYKLRRINAPCKSKSELLLDISNKIVPLIREDIDLYDPFIKAELGKYIQYEEKYYKENNKNYKKNYFFSSLTVSALALYASYKKPCMIKKYSSYLALAGLALYFICDLRISKRSYENEDLILGASRLHGIGINMLHI